MTLKDVKYINIGNNMTKKERRERAQRKINSYMNSILDTIEDVAHSNKYDTGQELLDAAIREANIKINALLRKIRKKRI